MKKYPPIHCVRVNSTANSSMNPLLLAVTVQIAKRFLLDYRFLSKPSFQTKFMETYHKVNRLEYIFDGVKCMTKNTFSVSNSNIACDVLFMYTYHKQRQHTVRQYYDERMTSCLLCYREKFTGTQFPWMPHLQPHLC